MYIRRIQRHDTLLQRSLVPWIYLQDVTVGLFDWTRSFASSKNIQKSVSDCSDCHGNKNHTRNPTVDIPSAPARFSIRVWSYLVRNFQNKVKKNYVNKAQIDSQDDIFFLSYPISADDFPCRIMCELQGDSQYGDPMRSLGSASSSVFLWWKLYPAALSRSIQTVVTW